MTSTPISRTTVPVAQGCMTLPPLSFSYASLQILFSEHLLPRSLVVCVLYVSAPLCSSADKLLNLERHKVQQLEVDLRLSQQAQFWPLLSSTPPSAAAKAPLAAAAMNSTKPGSIMASLSAVSIAAAAAAAAAAAVSMRACLRHHTDMQPAPVVRISSLTRALISSGQTRAEHNDVCSPSRPVQAALHTHSNATTVDVRDLSLLELSSAVYYVLRGV
jgi:hypothetical protein